MASEKNIKAARALVKRYREITKEDILGTEVLRDANVKTAATFARKCSSLWLQEKVSNELTGYGNKDTCTLCMSVRNPKTKEIDCEDCIYEIEDGCFKWDATDTFEGIQCAETIPQLLKAYKARADFIEETLRHIEETT